jgi:hypothetical protein
MGRMTVRISGAALALALIMTSVLSVYVFAKKALTVPFELERNKIIIPTSVNGSPPQRLILDTGMGFDGVYLFHKAALGLIDTTGAIEVRVPGAGSGEASRATMIETGRIAFGDVAVADQKIIVSHSEHTQTFPTDGVIGWNLFGHYIVEINYDSQRIFLHDTTYTPSDSDWTVLPVEMKKGLPFFTVDAEVIDGEVVPMLVYIDLASGDALELLVGPQQKFTMPKNLTASNLGTGLSGDINGQVGRSVRLNIGGFDLHDIRTAFAPAKVRSKQEGADGILGDDVIRRFNIIFDYPHARLYIKPNNTFQTPFD